MPRAWLLSGGVHGPALAPRAGYGAAWYSGYGPDYDRLALTEPGRADAVGVATEAGWLSSAPAAAGGAAVPGVQTARPGRCSPHGGVRPTARSITAAARRCYEDGRHTGSGATVPAPGAGARGW